VESQLSTRCGGATYRVADTTFTIVNTVDQAVWVRIESPPGNTSSALTLTIEPNSSPKAVAVVRSKSIMVAARTSSITLGKDVATLGPVISPIVGYTYTFQGNS
jgi:hypothetical protein